MKAIGKCTYQSPLSQTKTSLIIAKEHFWMTQMQMSLLFGCRVQQVHTTLKKLFASGELDPKLVNQTLEIPHASGRMIRGNFYNLDAVIAAGYRLNPKEATHLHIWSMQMLKAHLLEETPHVRTGIIGSLRQKITHMLAVA